MASARKRILFVTPPGYGHVFPIVRLALACQHAGHEVTVATCGVSLSVAGRAGLNAINVVPDVNLAPMFARYKESFREPYGYGPSVFMEIGDLMADGVMDAASRLRTELIVFTPDAAAAPLAAAKLGIPSVFLGLGLMHTPDLTSAAYRGKLSSEERFGLTEVRPPAAWIDVCPPSLRGSHHDYWRMRYVPYHGEDEVIGNVPVLDGRPRVLITLGTIVPHVEGLSAFRCLAAAAESISADFIMAHGTAHGRTLGDLPRNVHALTWFRLDLVLPGCAAVVHHGGSGTSLSALDAFAVEYHAPPTNPSSAEIDETFTMRPHAWTSAGQM